LAPAERAVRALALHGDVLLVSSALLGANCVVVRSCAGEGGEAACAACGPVSGDVTRAPGAEAFVIDSPVLPDELGALPALLEQAGFPAPSGLLATHGDWDHLLGRLAFPEVALGVAQSTAERLQAQPGAPQRELRAFDESLYIERERPLSLGSVQGLPVPGRCELGERELELHSADGHTADGMAVWIGWAGVLVAGDYLSTVELPTLGAGGSVEAYLATLARLRALAQSAAHVVPGHGPVVDGARAAAVLEEDAAYLRALSDVGAQAELPQGRRSREQRRLHASNVAALARGVAARTLRQ
jgi:glyoxylase-like metal-dependent hydrolase (beta-lactamase superfamily II)